MSHFQILGLTFLGCLIAASIARIRRNRATLRSSVFWIVLWLLAAVAIVKPELTTSVASLLGIGRGADLVFYCAILGMLLGFFWGYLRLRQLDAQLTQLVRVLALDRAQTSDGEARTSRPDAGDQSTH